MFFGTENYYDVFGVTVTDGIKYVMSNGYSWCISDVCVLLKLNEKLKTQEFVSVKLKVLSDKKAVITYEDGNNKILFKQEYGYTDALVDLTLFYTNNVLMLSSEY